MTNRRIWAVAMASVLLPELGAAETFPGRIDDELVGDWTCDGQRVYATRLGSIETIGSDYRAGLYDAADGLFAIEWDDGGRDDWGYRTGADGVIFTLPGGQDMACAPRG